MLKKYLLGFFGFLSAFVTQASAAITPPVPTYDDLYALGTVAVGVVLIIMLIKAGKRLFS
jgi:hypothetical protein